MPVARDLFLAERLWCWIRYLQENSFQFSSTQYSEKRDSRSHWLGHCSWRSNCWFSSYCQCWCWCPQSLCSFRANLHLLWSLCLRITKHWSWRRQPGSQPETLEMKCPLQVLPQELTLLSEPHFINFWKTEIWTFWGIPGMWGIRLCFGAGIFVPPKSYCDIQEKKVHTCPEYHQYPRWEKDRSSLMLFIPYTILTFLSHQHLCKISLLCVSSLLVPQMPFVKTVMVFQ